MKLCEWVCVCHCLASLRWQSLRQQLLQGMVDPHLHFLVGGYPGYGYFNYYYYYYPYCTYYYCYCWYIPIFYISPTIIYSSPSYPYPYPCPLHPLLLLLQVYLPLSLLSPSSPGLSPLSPVSLILTQCSQSSICTYPKWTTYSYSFNMGYMVYSSPYSLWMMIIIFLHSLMASSYRWPPHYPFFNILWMYLCMFPYSYQSRKGTKNYWFYRMQLHDYVRSSMCNYQLPQSWSDRDRNMQLPSPRTSLGFIFRGTSLFENFWQCSMYSFEALKTYDLNYFLFSFLCQFFWNFWQLFYFLGGGDCYRLFLLSFLPPILQVCRKGQIYLFIQSFINYLGIINRVNFYQMNKQLLASMYVIVCMLQYKFIILQNNLTQLIMYKTIKKLSASFTTLNQYYGINKNKPAVFFSNSDTFWSHNTVFNNAKALANGLGELGFYKGDSILVKLGEENNKQKLLYKIAASSRQVKIFKSKAKTQQQLTQQLKQTKARSFVFNSFDKIQKNSMIDMLYRLIPEIMSSGHDTQIIPANFRYLRSLVRVDNYKHSGTYSYQKLLKYDDAQNYTLNFECPEKLVQTQKQMTQKPIIITQPLDDLAFRIGVLSCLTLGRTLICSQKSKVKEYSQKFNHEVDIVVSEPMTQLHDKNILYVRRGSKLYQRHPNRVQIDL